MFSKKPKAVSTALLSFPPHVSEPLTMVRGEWAVPTQEWFTVTCTQRGEDPGTVSPKHPDLQELWDSQLVS